MYPNAGKSIKRVTAILVRLGYLISIIGAFALFVACVSIGSADYGILYLLLAIVIGGLGFLFSWLGGLCLYAYGEIADRLVSIDKRLAAMEKDAEEATVNQKSAGN